VRCHAEKSPPLCVRVTFFALPLIFRNKRFSLGARFSDGPKPYIKMVRFRPISSGSLFIPRDFFVSWNVTRPSPSTINCGLSLSPFSHGQRVRLVLSFSPLAAFLPLSPGSALHLHLELHPRAGRARTASPLLSLPFPRQLPFPRSEGSTLPFLCRGPLI